MYRRKQVEEMTGIPARRIQFYTDQGLLSTVEKATGRGNERQYSEDDVFKLAIIREMAELGLALATIKTFLMDEKEMKTHYEAMGYDYFDRISVKPFRDGQRYFFVHERLTDDSQIFKILTLNELQEKIKKQFLIDEGKSEVVEGDFVTSQVIINLGRIFDRINWI